MIEGVISILVIIFGIVGVLFEKRHSTKAIKEKEARERDQELANHDSDAIDSRLSDYVDRMPIFPDKKEGKDSVARGKNE